MSRGANWIHGSNDNPIMTIACETGTQYIGLTETLDYLSVLTITRLKVWDELMKVFDADGSELSQGEVEEYSALQWDNIIAAAFRHSRNDHDKISPDTSLFDFFSERAETMFQDQPADVADQKRTKLLQLARGWGAYIGSPISRQSLKFFWLEECLDGENPFVAGTYSKILDAVAESAKRNADIQLACEVVEIRSERTSEDDRARTQPSVKTADGSCLVFDELVLTAPLGWLKGNKDVFKPALTLGLSQAFDSISYGRLDKVYLTFPSVWWASSPAEWEVDDVSPQAASSHGRAWLMQSENARIHFLAPAELRGLNESRSVATGMHRSLSFTTRKCPPDSPLLHSRTSKQVHR